MRRAIRVAAHELHGAVPVDTLLLTAEQRQNPRGVFTGVGGTAIAVELAEALRLRGGDHLELDGGGVVEIVAEPEPLIEVRAGDLTALARIAWHLGDRHVPLQIFERRLRLRRDPSVEALLAKLGAKVTPIAAPFDPEGGAYSHAAHHHHHGDHQHGHDPHDHDHHRHAHGHGDHHRHEGRSGDADRRNRRREPGTF